MYAYSVMYLNSGVDFGRICSNRNDLSYGLSMNEIKNQQGLDGKNRPPFPRAVGTTGSCCNQEQSLEYQLQYKASLGSFPITLPNVGLDTKLQILMLRSSARLVEHFWLASASEVVGATVLGLIRLQAWFANTNWNEIYKRQNFSWEA